MSESVPEVLTIEEIYPPEFGAAQKQRWKHLLAEFEERYGAPAHYVARSPGRVNIIGEVKTFLSPLKIQILIKLPSTSITCSSLPSPWL